MSSTLLADGAYCELVSDGFQAMCAAADVLPRPMDAADDLASSRSVFREPPPV